MKKQQLDFINSMKGIDIIIIIISHIAGINYIFNCWISAFMLPTFFAVSGFLMQYNEETENSFMTVLKKKARQLLIPYLWFSVINIFIMLGMVKVHYFDSDQLKEYILETVSFYGISVLWFLPALFIGYLTFYLLEKILKKAPLALIIAICFFVTGFIVSKYIRAFFHSHEYSETLFTFTNVAFVLVRGIAMSAYIGVGYCMAEVRAWLKAHQSDDFLMDKSGKRWVGIIIGVLMFWIVYRICPALGILVYPNLNHICYIFRTLVCGTLGSIAFLLLCINVPRIPLITPVIHFFGKNSLVIMATHTTFYYLYAAELIANQLNRFIIHAKQYIWYFNVLLFTMLFETLTILIINRFFPFILGRSKH
jgi:hypothetical protein